VQVRGRGDAYYAGTIEPRAPELTGKPSFDPLATVIADAHAAGLQVHAWVSVNLVSSSVSLPASRDHLIYRAPEWLMVPRELAAEMKKIDLRSPAYVGRLARWTRAHASIVEGLYTSPLHPAAQDHNRRRHRRDRRQVPRRRHSSGLRAVSERGFRLQRLRDGAVQVSDLPD
jgi:hypothetical protein